MLPVTRCPRQCIVRRPGVASQRRAMPRRAVGLSHHDGDLDRHGAGPAIAVPEPDHLINHQDRDHKHERPRDRVGGQGVTVPLAPQSGVGQIKDHQGGSHQRNGGGGEPA